MNVGNGRLIEEIEEEMCNKVNGLRHIHQFPTFPINIEARTNQTKKETAIYSIIGLFF